MIEMAAIVVMCATYSDGTKDCDIRASKVIADVSYSNCRKKLTDGIVKITKELQIVEPGAIMSFTSAECVARKDYSVTLSIQPEILQDLGYEELSLTFY